MGSAPWLTIIGVGEDGLDGLTPASRLALEEAEVVMGPARHMALLPGFGSERVEWPVPFADGIEVLKGYRGRQVAVLASGDPFWFGAGGALAQHFVAGEWRALPGVSTFSLIAARLGWGLEGVTCLGLHAAPLARLRPHLADRARVIALLRDGDAVGALGAFLSGAGFGESKAWVCEAVGGPREVIRECRAADLAKVGAAHPVAVALECVGVGLPKASGLPDDTFAHDGQITKQPVRAVTLSALAPRPFEMLWDIGSGSGSIALEWLISDPRTQAVSVEKSPERAARIAENAAALGVDRLHVVEGEAPAALAGLPKPDAIFIGGGLSDALLKRLEADHPGVRLVANAVTLESEALLQRWQARLGGSLMRLEISHAAPLGPRTGWKAAYPVVQWSVVL